MPKTMMVCSGGGHLKQLFTLSSRLGVAPEDQVWITFENGLSSSLLEGREVHYAPFVAPRDLRNLWRLRSLASRVMRKQTWDRAFSTGSSPAVAVLPMAAARGAEAHYIESAARADGPSMSGRILERLGRVHTYTQYPSWQSSRWQYGGSIYDGFVAGPTTRSDAHPQGRGHGRDAGGLRLRPAVRALVPLLADCDEVLWQTGTQDVSRWGSKAGTACPTPS